MNRNPRSVLIGIGGASGAGKSALADAISHRLGVDLVEVIPIDAYYCDFPDASSDERSRLNFDAPDALEWPLLRTHLYDLLQGKSIQRPEYDFSIHRRLPNFITVDPVRFVILEGVPALYDAALRELMQVRVYVEVDEALCLKRRIERDMRERGRSRESIIAQYSTTVKPMFEQYVRPTRSHADLIVPGDQSLSQSAQQVVRLLLP